MSFSFFSSQSVGDSVNTIDSVSWARLTGVQLDVFRLIQLCNLYCEHVVHFEALFCSLLLKKSSY